MTIKTKTLMKSAALALVALSAPVLVSTPVNAQSRTGISVANYEAAILKSQAFQTAATQMQTTYKADIDQTRARATALQAEMQPLIDALNAAAKQPGATPQSIQPQAQALQQKRNSGQQELGQLQQRVTLARAYVEEQIAAKLDDAIKAAMRTKKVDLVLQPQAVVAREPYVDITDDIVLELNKLIPSASIMPPAGWQPGQNEQQAQQPAAAQPTGR